MKRITIILGLTTAALAQQLFAGPFGFEKGMTRQQILAIVGSSAVEKTYPDMIRLSTAPKPHSAFDGYLLIFDTEGGLVKILASGKPIPTNGFGRR